jgi:SpoVK/Ycf46/Vps4 family AAA+-type ATPase
MFIGIDEAKHALTTTLQYNFFSHFETGNIVIDNLIRMLFITFISTFVASLMSNIGKINLKFSLRGIRNMFKKYYTITITGSRYVEFKYMHSRCDFSMRFRSVLYKILCSLNENNGKNGIREIEELQIRDTTRFNDDNSITKKTEFSFIVNQRKMFLIDTDIYCEVDSFNDNVESGDKNKTTGMKKQEYTICIKSTKKTCKELHSYIEQITDEYEKNQKRLMSEHRYIFQFDGINADSKLLNWKVNIYKSFTTFDNIFFEEKAEVFQRLTDFMKEKEFYQMLGKPWKLGILLTGEPGCGKTSLIRAIANFFKRSIKDVQFNRMTDIDDLESCFNCIEYDNKAMGSEDVILVAEDIDCMTDIIKKRTAEEPKKNMTEQFNSFKSEEAKAIMMAISSATDSPTVTNKKSGREITLSYLLNILDGISNADGRIFIASTNHVEKIDPAALRPGRIDIRIDFKRASVSIVREILSHWYECYDKHHSGADFHSEFERLWDENSSRFNDEKLKPCDIVNVLQAYCRDIQKALDILISMQ